jgi:precorrin-2 dehydrogenase/sirohydrochlorin ferrochelatase
MFPVALDLTQLVAAVAGAGRAAKQRVRLLDEAGAKGVLVFAPDADEELATMAGDRLVARLPDEADLDGIDILFVADLGAETETRLAVMARSRKVLLNTEDVRPLCDFHVPAMVRRGDLLLAVSTGGASPGLARRLKAHLAEIFGEEWADHVSEIAGARARWREEGVSFADLGKRTNALIDEKGWLS